jgi:hypothetical protein
MVLESVSPFGFNIFVLYICVVQCWVHIYLQWLYLIANWYFYQSPFFFVSITITILQSALSIMSIANPVCLWTFMLTSFLTLHFHLSVTLSVKFLIGSKQLGLFSFAHSAILSFVWWI